ncbi:MFS transporter [Sphingobium mellinum]|uniref:MFS transporter n=1 Tax=Sphingobium mellinum TaxID=1387166 RepID=UPI0030EE78CA
MLSALYVFSLIDRQIFVLLIGPIKAQFQLSDVQIGLLIGTAFAAVYSFLGIPAGRIADRGNRKLLIVAGAVIWCLSTIASGFAASYAVLVLLRLGLAAGEAVLTPAAHSMIGDLFPPEKRSLAASLYTSAGLIGAPLAFSGGALVISGIEGMMAGGVRIDMQVWQIVLFIVGLPSLALAILFLLLVREPLRSSEPDHVQALAKGDILRQIASRKKLYAGLFISSVLASGCSYALNYWTIESLKRDFGWSAVEAGSAFGPVIFLASVTGVLGAPWITARLRARGRADAVVLASFAFLAAAFVSLAVGPLLSHPALRLTLIGVGLIGALGSGMNIVISMQQVAPARMRATFVALLYMGITLFGAGAVPVVVPLVGSMIGASGWLSAGLAIVCAALSAVGLFFLWWIRADFEREAIAGFPAVGAST